MPGNTFRLMNLTVMDTSKSVSINVEEAQITGAGGYYSPRLLIPITLGPDRTGPSDTTIFVSTLTARVSLSRAPTFDYMASTTQATWLRLVSPANIPLRFDLNQGLIEHIEEQRNGGDLHFDLAVSISVVAVDESPGSGTHGSKAAISAAGIANADLSLPLRIFESHWVKHILPSLGYLQKHIIEFTVPQSGGLASEFSTALQELRKAERQFQEDDWKGSWITCRNALNAVASAFRLELEPDQKAEYKTRVRAFETQQLVPVLGRTKASMVAALLMALWAPLSAPTKPGEFEVDRRSAKFMLDTVAGLVGYLGRAFR